MSALTRFLVWLSDPYKPFLEVLLSYIIVGTITGVLGAAFFVLIAGRP